MNRVAEMRILIQILSLHIQSLDTGPGSAYGLLQGWRYTARSDSGIAELSRVPLAPSGQGVAPMSRRPSGVSTPSAPELSTVCTS